MENHKTSIKNKQNNIQKKKTTKNVKKKKTTKNHSRPKKNKKTTQIQRSQVLQRPIFIFFFVDCEDLVVESAENNIKDRQQRMFLLSMVDNLFVILNYFFENV